VEGPFATQAYYSRIALHHHAVKSEEDFMERLHQGSVMSEGGADRAFWTQTERTCVPCPAAPACTFALAASSPASCLPSVLRPLATLPCRTGRPVVDRLQGSGYVLQRQEGLAAPVRRG
jgi:hypothetical protein